MLLILELYSCYVSTHWESRVEMGEKGRPGGPAGVLEDQVVCLSTQRWGHALGLRSTWQPAFTKMGQLCFALFYALCARAPDPCNAHRPPLGSHAGLQCWASNSLRGNYFHRAYKLHLTKPSQKNLRFQLHWKSFDAPVFPGSTNIYYFFFLFCSSDLPVLAVPVKALGKNTQKTEQQWLYPARWPKASDLNAELSHGCSLPASQPRLPTCG